MQKIKVFAASSFKKEAKGLAKEVNRQIEAWQKENPKVVILGAELQTKSIALPYHTMGDFINGYRIYGGGTEITVAALIRYKVKK